MDLTTVTTNLNLDWMQIERSPRGEALLGLLAATRPKLQGCSLTRALAVDGPLDSLERHEVLAELLVLGAREPLALRALIQGLLPGLVGLVRQLGWARASTWASPGDLVVDAISNAFEIASRWAGQRRRFAGPDLLSAVRLRLRRQAIADRRGETCSLDEVAETEQLRGHLTVEEILCERALELDSCTASVLVGRLAKGLTWQELHEVMGLPIRQIHTIAEDGARQLLGPLDVSCDSSSAVRART